jgi:hypothetical protein
MDNGTENAQPAPDNIEEILLARADYEEAKIREIKKAVDVQDKDKVFQLATELIYDGPGTLPRT